MTNIKKITALLCGMIAITTIIISSCSKDATVIIPLSKGPVVTKTVSFSKDLAPIFTAHCALSGCHVSGGQKPDLDASKAYVALTSTSGGITFINKSAPESSIIYERLTGKLTPQMPMGATANPSNIEGLMLAWIQQGAKNN